MKNYLRLAFIMLLCAALLCACAEGGNGNSEASSVAESGESSVAESVESSESTAEAEAVLNIAVATPRQISDSENYEHFYDSDAIEQRWIIVIETDTDVNDFCVVALDESEMLKVTDTRFTLDTLRADKPIIIHTYINDVTLNRGIAYTAKDGTVRYFGIYCSMYDGSVSLKEIHPVEAE